MKVTLSSKKEIIGELAKRSHVTRELAGYVYHNLLDIILERLKKGEEINLSGIGKFKYLNKRSSVSNITKQVIPPHLQIKFKFNPKMARFIRVMSREY